MAKYRKKPVVIEAFQMTKKNRWITDNWPNWLLEAFNPKEAEIIMSFDPNGDQLVISTLEGVLRVEWNDWIIKGVKGELYPCKPDIFEQTYEKVEE